MDNVIAIDGPAASGKSTIANQVAQRLGIYYINTGNMYRGATLLALENNITSETPSEKELEKLASDNQITYEKDKSGKLVLTINGKEADLDKIRSPEVTLYVSVISKSNAIRNWLVREQRKMTSLGYILMEGRDIGTNVFPNARYKFFLTASPEIRAIRRLSQGGETPKNATVASVARDIALRDELDSKRAIAPLRKADDAILLDSSHLSIDEVLNKIMTLLRENYDLTKK
ncbi:MAG TPA: (d)CMP kinase [Lentisphaeria bacterium]|nr:MAG: cytidylate kinase [Lentisphaerae bacterium GWF2_38_69]HBM15181.1 (d)CMP kinase [Lentisphaeria bacterium]